MSTVTVRGRNCVAVVVVGILVSGTSYADDGPKLEKLASEVAAVERTIADPVAGRGEFQRAAETLNVLLQQVDKLIGEEKQRGHQNEGHIDKYQLRAVYLHEAEPFTVRQSSRPAAIFGHFRNILQSSCTTLIMDLPMVFLTYSSDSRERCQCIQTHL